MPKIARLTNTLRNYAWGDTTEMSRVLDRDPSGEPEAELWMGAHPSAPSLVDYEGKLQPLDALIASDPVAWLGEDVVKTHGPRLPFLFKVLAAGQPLSLQAHPTREQAIKGFADENARGVPLNASFRNYKDANHKPEVTCALTDFHALCGFRPYPEIVAFLGELSSPVIATESKAFVDQPTPETLGQLFEAVMSLGGSAKDLLVQDVIAYAKRHADDYAWNWISRLETWYPGDIGIAGAALLNVVHLKPGQALYQGAGLLHAYLQGVGVELMANSDNVLRGGLTPKHIDVPELMRTLSFGSTTPALLTPSTDGSILTPSEEFVLSQHALAGQAIKLQSKALQIVICLEGKSTVSNTATGSSVALSQGESIVIPASVGCCSAIGHGKLYTATVPG